MVTETISDASTSTIAIPPSTSSEKSIKRKLEDAIQSLDEAVGPSLSIIDRPSPPKRLRTARSIYATLAKYGIKKDPKPIPTNDFAQLSKTAPHLAAILSRTATRTRKALPFQLGHVPAKSSLTASPSTSDYRPSSTASFLTRLATYKLSTYANKPPAIDAVAAAKCGWVNDGKDRLLCGICGVSWVVAGKDGMSRDAANTLVEKQRVSLVDMHKNGCPWKTRQCDGTFGHDSANQVESDYIGLSAARCRDQTSSGEAFTSLVTRTIVNVLDSQALSQVQTLLAIVSSVSVPTYSTDHDATSESTSPFTFNSSAPRAEPSETAVLASLFGWSILPPGTTTEQIRASSISRPTSGIALTPSRPPSVASFRESTPTPSTPRPPLRAALLAQTSPARSLPQIKPDTTLLHCSLCQRRIGLWAFLPPPANGTTEGGNAKPQARRQLDVLREHRSHCPYVVRSTVMPSIPAPPLATTHSRSGSTASLSSTSLTQFSAQSGLMEGWRAVLTAVMRYGASQRQRLGLSRIPSGRRAGEADNGAEPFPDTSTEMDSVEAMVAGVKSRGGKDLLKYVKGILG
ncbi:hypothetical protein A0H81_07767 [Grifola frondosa]|uniref:Zf-C3HC-domain-containing protein n=1 Tax=Grifola frondosa TaxID=5627 RepID=A0A1C7M552_GRIFR|nr:hypothetical protein A0H81_07767 [Grifola frondosa]